MLLSQIAPRTAGTAIHGAINDLKGLYTMDAKRPIAYHWLTVGYISDGAKKWVVDIGGQVRPLSEDPPLIAVALAYNPQGAWTWSHGRQEHRQGIEYWSSGELQEASTGITLQYRSSSDPHTLAEYCSAETNYLILPDEEFVTEIHQVQDPGMYGKLPVEDWGDLGLGDLDDHPF